MAPKGKGRGRGRGKGVTNASKRPNPTSTQPPPVNNRKSTSAPLSHRYEITPPNAKPTTVTQRSPVPVFHAPPEGGVRHYPPPQSLFPNSASPYSGSGPSVSPQPRATTPLQPRGSSSTRQPLNFMTLQPGCSLLQDPRSSPHKHEPRTSNPRQSTPTSSQAQNDDFVEDDEDEYSEEDEDEDEEQEAEAPDDTAPIEPNLPADVLAALHDLLIQPGREEYTTLLSPHLEDGKTW